MRTFIGDNVNDLWKTADLFRNWVCRELHQLPQAQRLSLRGDYLFVIDHEPRFIVLVDEQGAWSVVLHGENQFSVDALCPIEVTQDLIEGCIAHASRTCVTTDSQTLKLILFGKMKAKLAFLKGKVKLSGDLAAFLKMVSLLKQSGVRPLAEVAVS
jgi:hypothetical protein